MNDFTSISFELKGLNAYFDEILAKKYNISAFLTENLYSREFVKKLWYDLLKRTPIDNFVIWHTDLKFLSRQNYYKGQFMDYGFENSKYQLSLFQDTEPVYVLKDQEKEVLVENFFFFN